MTEPLPHDGLIRKVNSTNPDTNAWALFERAEIDPDGFVTLTRWDVAMIERDFAAAERAVDACQIETSAVHDVESTDWKEIIIN